MSLIRSIIYFLNIVIHKKKNRIFFRSTFLYPDNIDAVVEELLKNENDFEIIVDEPVFRYSNNNKVKQVKNKFQSLRYFLTSKYVFWDTGAFKNPRAIKKQITVNLWHGVSFKKIGFFLDKSEKPYPTSTYVVTYSNFFAGLMSKAFGVSLDCVLKTGEPRNDFLDKKPSKEILTSLNLLNKKEKIVFWMPTYRQNKADGTTDSVNYNFGFPFLDKNNIHELNNFCKEKNIILILKWHGLQESSTEFDQSIFSNLLFLTSEKLAEYDTALNSFLSISDALITDYSSVFINYLLLDKPICFAYDDIDYYKNHRGFMFDDIESCMPGYKAKTLNELKTFLSDLSVNKDLYSKTRHDSFAFFNNYMDNKNAKRLLTYLKLLKDE